MHFRRALQAFFATCGLGVTLLSTSCGTNNFSTTSLTEDESDAALAALDNAPTAPSTPLSQIILGDGTTVQSVLNEYGVSPPAPGVGINAIDRAHPQAQPSSPNEYVRLAVAQMLAEAELLSYRPNWQYPNDGPDAPAQNGLAYVYGSKHFQSRTTAGCCPQLHGLDCSGLMSLVAQEAGLYVLDGTVNQKNPSAWTIPASWGVQMTSIPTTSPLQSGDIIYWNDAQTNYSGHIGIVDNGDIVQANGVYVATCNSAGTASCARNYSTHRGPNKWSIATTAATFGNPSIVLRLLPAGATYTYSGLPFGYNDDPSVLGTHLSASVTFNKPLLPNMTVQAISPSCPLPACFYTSSGQDFSFAITNIEISAGNTVVSVSTNCGGACVYTMITDSSGNIGSAFLSGVAHQLPNGGSQFAFNIGAPPSSGNDRCLVFSNGIITNSILGPDSVAYASMWSPALLDTFCAVAYGAGTWSGPF